MTARTNSAHCSPAALTGALLAAGLLLTACGGDSAADTTAAVDAAVEEAGVEGLPEPPEECLEPFPLSVGGATLDDVELIPADWPAAPDGATLCGTGGTFEGNQEYAEYAVSLEGEELLGHYEAAFPASYTVERGEGISGTILSGAAGDVYFTVEPRSDGAGLYISFGVDT